MSGLFGNGLLGNALTPSASQQYELERNMIEAQRLAYMQQMASKEYAGLANQYAAPAPARPQEPEHNPNLLLLGEDE
jgi:hypothetical protein